MLRALVVAAAAALAGRVGAEVTLGAVALDSAFHVLDCGVVTGDSCRYDSLEAKAEIAPFHFLPNVLGECIFASYIIPAEPGALAFYGAADGHTTLLRLVIGGMPPSGCLVDTFSSAPCPPRTPGSASVVLSTVDSLCFAGSPTCLPMRARAGEIDSAALALAADGWQSDTGLLLRLPAIGFGGVLLTPQEVHAEYWVDGLRYVALLRSTTASAVRGPQVSHPAVARRCERPDEIFDMRGREVGRLSRPRATGIVVERSGKVVVRPCNATAQ